MNTVYVVLRHYFYEGGQFKFIAPTREAAQVLAESDSEKPLKWGKIDSDGEQDGEPPSDKWGLSFWYTIYESHMDEESEWEE